MVKIETLTAAQWADVAAACESVLARCLSGPIDRGAFEAGVEACWAHLGFEKPAVVWAPGPLSALVYGAALSSGASSGTSSQLGGQLWDQLGGQLRDQLRGQLGGQLEDQLRDRLWGQLRDQLGGQLRDQLWDQLRDQLWDQLRDQLGGQLRDQLRGQLRDQLWGSIMWAQDLAWLEMWLHVNTIDGLIPVGDDLAALTRHWANCLTSHIWVPYRNVVIASDHHISLHRDNQNRLHNPDGAAWLWADGTAVWALDGIRVPPWVIYDRDTDGYPARVLKDLPNSEQRRVAFAHYGWGRAVKHLGLVPIDEHPDPHMGALYRLPEGLHDGDGATLLVCRNASPHLDGTWQTYGLLADPSAETVEQAQASLAGLSVTDWFDLIEVAT